MVFNDVSKDKDTKNGKFAQENGVRNAECSGSEYTENDTVLRSLWRVRIY